MPKHSIACLLLASSIANFSASPAFPRPAGPALRDPASFETEALDLPVAFVSRRLLADVPRARSLASHLALRYPAARRILDGLAEMALHFEFRRGFEQINRRIVPLDPGRYGFLTPDDLSTVFRATSGMGFDAFGLWFHLENTVRQGGIDRGVERWGAWSVAHHSLYMMLLTAHFGREIGLPEAGVDEAIRMAFAHDMAETITGDITPADPLGRWDNGKEEAEAEAWDEIVRASPRLQWLRILWRRYTEKKGPIAKCAKTIDKVAGLVELLAYAQQFPEAFSGCLEIPGDPNNQWEQAKEAIKMVKRERYISVLRFYGQIRKTREEMMRFPSVDDADMPMGRRRFGKQNSAKPRWSKEYAQLERAVEDILHLLENDGLAVQMGWTAGDRAAYVEIVRAFSQNGNFVPSSDNRPYYMWVDPNDNARIAYRPDLVAKLDRFSAMLVVGHELFHLIPRHLALGAALRDAIRAASGRPSVEDQEARRNWKHAIALAATIEAEAYAFEMRLAEELARFERQDLATFMARRRAMAPKSRLLWSSFQDLYRNDPAFARPETRAGLIVDAKAVLTSKIERGMMMIHEWEHAYDGATPDLKAWLTEWILEPGDGAPPADRNLNSPRPPTPPSHGLFGSA